MPILITTDEPLRLITLVFEGTISEEELLAQVSNLQTNPNLNSEFDKIVDERNATIEMDRMARRELFQYIAANIEPTHGCIAILASDPVEIALGMIFEKNPNTRQKVKVFSTAEAAYGWLRKKPQNPLHDS